MPTGSTNPGQDLKDRVLKEVMVAKPEKKKGIDQGRQGRNRGKERERLVS